MSNVHEVSISRVRLVKDLEQAVRIRDKSGNGWILICNEIKPFNPKHAHLKYSTKVTLARERDSREVVIRCACFAGLKLQREESIPRVLIFFKLDNRVKGKLSDFSK